MEKKTYLRVKGKSVKMHALENFHRVVLTAAHELQKETVMLTRVPTKRDMERFRALLDPAYVAIAEAINTLMPNPLHRYRFDELSNLKVEFKPTIGTYDVHVISTVDDGKVCVRQNYVLKVNPSDGLTLLMRANRKMPIEVGKDRAEEVVKLFDSL